MKVAYPKVFIEIKSSKFTKGDFGILTCWAQKIRVTFLM